MPGSGNNEIGKTAGEDRPTVEREQLKREYVRFLCALYRSSRPYA